jgi:hypothetical protein
MTLFPALMVFDLYIQHNAGAGFPRPDASITDAGGVKGVPTLLVAFISETPSTPGTSQAPLRRQ